MYYFSWKQEIEEERFYDPSYVEVDKIINTTELFPIVHPKKVILK